MMQETYVDRFHQTVRNDGRYPLDAYEFLHRGLDHTTRRLYGERDCDASPRHISGTQLCDGLRELALQQWGRLAAEVLRRWGITSTRDFGEMVFVLVEAGLLGKQDEDRIEDFVAVYDFEQAFGDCEIPLEAFDAALDTRASGAKG
jgi:uncharacterized repeat protein (TIGR04138 family)